MLSFQAKLNLTPRKKERAESSSAGYSVLTKPDISTPNFTNRSSGQKYEIPVVFFTSLGTSKKRRANSTENSADRLRMASIVDTNWQNFLAPDSDLPPDVVFLVKADGIERFFGALPGWS